MFKSGQILTISVAIIALIISACNSTNHQVVEEIEEKDSFYLVSRYTGDTIPTGVPFMVEGFVRDTSQIKLSTSRSVSYLIERNEQYVYKNYPVDIDTIPIYEDSAMVITPGKDTMELAIVQKTNPESKFLIASEHRKILEPRFKESAIADIQYLDGESGLNTSFLTCILKSHNGLMWIGSKKGISIFDGLFVTDFTTENGLPDNEINCLFEDSKNNIWIGTNFGGAVKYDGTKISIYDMSQGLLSNQVNSICEDSKGNIWLGQWGGGITKIESDSSYSWGREQGLLETRVLGVSCDEQDRIWIATNGGGFYKFYNETFYRYIRQTSFSAGYVISSFHDSQGRHWIGNWDYPQFIKDDKRYVFDRPSIVGGFPIVQYYEDSKGNIWMISFVGGVMCYNGETFTVLNEETGLPNNTVYGCVEDNAGNMWFVLDGGGLVRYNPNSFNYFDEKSGMNSQLVSRVIQKEDGQLVIGTSSGVVFYNDTAFYKVVYADKTTTLGGNVYDVLFDKKDSSIWFGILNNALFRFHKNQLYKYTANNGTPDHNMTAMAQRENGEIWMGTYNVGVGVLYDDHFTIYNAKCGFNNYLIIDIIVDHKDQVWIGSDGEGVTLYDGEMFTHLTTNENLPNNHINGIFEDSYSNVWILTKDGVGIYQNGLITDLTKELNLPDRNVSDLVQDANGNYWMMTTSGILYLKNEQNATEWNINNYSQQVFKQFHGLRGLDIRNRSAFIDDKNRIWFGSGKGLMMKELNEYNFQPNPPEAILSSIKINGQFIDYNSLNTNQNELTFKHDLSESIQPCEPFTNYPNSMSLPSHLNHLTFNFSTQGWYSGNIKFSYMLDGLDTSWSKPSIESWAEYRNLSYGDYTFKLKVISDDKYEGKELNYAFSILPPWYHTWWARIIFLLVAFLLVRIIVKQRTKHLLVKQQELELKVQERTAELDVKNKELVSQNTIIEEQKEEVEKRKEEIERQHTLLEETHKEIKDSINYAKRIQEAILPTDEFIASLIPNKFVLYCPKDVVAGDFYWIDEVNNQILFAAADCTGHGVPGAMVSVVCYNALNRTVREFGESSPEKILDKTREIVLETFQQNTSQVNDGMDCAIISISKNKDKRTLYFSGANNSVVIIRNLDIIELKGDKQPVGNFKNMKPFSLQNIELQKDDIIYLYTDGYADQFGGNDRPHGKAGGKKLKSKVLKELLLSISHLPLDKQRDELFSFLEKWKGDFEQLDDISVFGFKI